MGEKGKLATMESATPTTRTMSFVLLLTLIKNTGIVASPRPIPKAGGTGERKQNLGPSCHLGKFQALTLILFDDQRQPRLFQGTDPAHVWTLLNALEGKLYFNSREVYERCFWKTDPGRTPVQ